MFFSQIILMKRGPLGKIWLAGHWDKKISKNVVLQTNISKVIKRILSPHLPMALRMTSHLLLGVVRIYSKKAKFLLNDVSDAVTKLKTLTKKITTKIDQPVAESVDPQALLTTGPRAADASKPQVYKEVDRFLRNIDVRDLVMDSFYDPSRINPEPKQTLDDLGTLQTPPGQDQPGDILGSRNSDTGESSKKRYKYDGEDIQMREFEQPDILSPKAQIESPGLDQRSPVEIGSVNKNIGDLQPLEYQFDPLNLGNFITPPGLGEQVVDDLNREDFNQQLNIGDIPGKLNFGDGEEDRPQNNQDMEFEQGGGMDFGPYSPVQQPQDQQQYSELTEEEKQKLAEDEMQTTQLPTAEKKKRQKRITQAGISKKDKRRYENVKAIITSRNLLPFQQPIIPKSKDLSFKHDLLAPTRIGMANKLVQFYQETLQYKMPAIVGINSVLPLAYLRGRRSYFVVTRADTETQFLQSAKRTPMDLGIPSYPTYNHEEEKKREKVILASLNNRDLENEKEPQAVPLVQPDEPEDKTIYDDFMEEIQLRREQGTPLFYHSRLGEQDNESIEKLMRPKTPGQLDSISPYRAIPMIDETGSVKSKQTPLKPIEEDRSQQPQFNDEYPGGYEWDVGGNDLPPYQQPVHEEEDTTKPSDDKVDISNLSEDEKEKRKHRLASKQSEQRKKIWSQKTAKMHTILNSYYKQTTQINFLDDMVQGQNKKRSVAAGIFYELLILKTKDLVELKQSEPYGDIIIKKTDQFDYVDDWKVVDEKD